MKCFVYRHQKGVIIVVALIMLLVMTTIGITIMSTSILQERLAGNYQQKTISRTNAEAALRQAEDFLTGLNISNEVDINTHFGTSGDAFYRVLTSSSYVADEPNSNMSESGNWSASNSQAAIGSTGATAPRYLIEYLGQLSDKGASKSFSLDAEDKNKFNPTPYAFRITAIGYGQNDKTSTILQSIYSTQQGAP